MGWREARALPWAGMFRPVGAEESVAAEEPFAAGGAMERARGIRVSWGDRRSYSDSFFYFALLAAFTAPFLVADFVIFLVVPSPFVSSTKETDGSVTMPFGPRAVIVETSSLTTP